MKAEAVAAKAGSAGPRADEDEHAHARVRMRMRVRRLPRIPRDFVRAFTPSLRRAKDFEFAVGYAPTCAPSCWEEPADSILSALPSDLVDGQGNYRQFGE